MDARLRPFVRDAIRNGWRLDEVGDQRAQLSRRSWRRLRRDLKLVQLCPNHSVTVTTREGDFTFTVVENPRLVRARLFGTMDDYLAQLPH